MQRTRAMHRYTGTGQLSIPFVRATQRAHFEPRNESPMRGPRLPIPRHSYPVRSYVPTTSQHSTRPGLLRLLTGNVSGGFASVAFRRF
jgi:hypothetical protein